ncbi:MAG: zinc ribbon domain-containing protein [Candidatus Nanoarchaeia archaeon]|nr:zinc ribbon domain-containing protein [Candidatus Nanoarchaeia archaeon]
MNCKRCNNNSEKGDLFCRKCGEELPAEETFQCECGSEVRNEDRFCHNCGAMFSAGNCGNCSAELVPNAKYCHECGTKAEENAGTSEAPSYLSEPVNEAPSEPPYSPETYTPEKEAPADIEVYDDYGNVKKISEFKEEPPKKPKYKMSGDGYFEP